MISKILTFIKKIPIFEIAFVLFFPLAQYQYNLSSVGLILILIISLIWFLRKRRVVVFLPLLFFALIAFLNAFLSSFSENNAIEPLKYLLIFMALMFVLASAISYADVDKLEVSWIVIGLVLSFGIFYHVVVLKMHSSDPNYGVSIIRILPLPTKEYYRNRFLEKSTRPIGFFMEPASYCSFTIFSAFFAAKRKKYLLSSILILSMLLSGSSAGIVFSIIIGFYVLISFVKDKKINKIIKIIVPCALIIAIITLFVLSKNAQNSVAKIFSSNSSTTIRMFSGFQVFSNLSFWHKVFGSGFRNTVLLLDSNTIDIPITQHTDYGFTNGLSETLITNGIIGLIFLLILLFYLLRLSKSSTLPLLLCFSFALLGQTIYFNSYFVIFMAILVLEIVDRKNSSNLHIFKELNFSKIMHKLFYPIIRFTNFLLKPKSEKKSWMFLIALSFFTAAISFVKEIIFAYIYGANNVSDAYNISIQIPLIIFSIITTSISTILVPVYISNKKAGKIEEGDRLISNFLVILELFSFIISLICIIFAEQLILLFAPGYTSETRAIAVPLFRIASSFILFFNIIDVNTGILHSHDIYAFPKITSSIRNITEIILVIIIGDALGIKAAVLGIFVGIIIETIISVSVNTRRFTFSPSFKKNDKELWSLFKMIIPIAIGVGLDDINKIADKVISSFLEEGSVSLISYSTRISSMISTILLSSFGIIALSSFAKLVASNDLEGLNNKFSESFSTMLFVSLPLSIGGILMSDEIIKIIYGRGAFIESPDNVNIASNLLKIYFASVPIESIRSVCSKLLYAKKDTRTAMINGLIGVIINVGLSSLSVFVLKWGVYGVAAATVIANLAITIFLVVRVKVKCKVSLMKCLKTSWKPVVSSLIMGITCLILSTILRANAQIDLLILIIAVVVSAVMYIGILFIVRYELVISAFKAIKAKMFKR
ncbi:MAG: murein biosynthesis integral membrane protein MurJ [Bacilli bacterium]|nr:murein biosynthesis integral membrane protein MurJ [Bacilli bacterium]